jgi:hypothetical protein
MIAEFNERQIDKAIDTAKHQVNEYHQALIHLQGLEMAGHPPEVLKSDPGRSIQQKVNYIEELITTRNDLMTAVDHITYELGNSLTGVTRALKEFQNFSFAPVATEVKKQPAKK